MRPVPLLPLCELAAKIQGVRAVGGVLKAAEEGLEPLGLRLVVLQREGEGLFFRALSLPADAKTKLEEDVGAVSNRPFALASADIDLECSAEPRARYLADAADWLEQVLRPSAREPSGLHALLQEAGLATGVLRPLTREGSVWGLALICALDLVPEDSAALGLFAGHLSAALEAAQLVETLEKRNRELSVIEEVTRAAQTTNLEELIGDLQKVAAKVTDSQRCGLWLMEGGGSSLVMAARPMGCGAELLHELWRIPVGGPGDCRIDVSPAPRGFHVETQWPASSRRAVRAAGFIECALVVLHIDGRVVGAMMLGRTEPRPYTADELHLADLLAGQFALQIERVRLYADAQQRLSDLSLINDVGHLIAQHLDLPTVLTTAVRHMTRLSDVPNGFIHLIDEERRGLHMVAFTGTLDGEVYIRLEEQSAATTAVRTLMPVVIEDTLNDPRPKRSLIQRFKHTALLAVPLISQGQPIGAIILGDTRGPRRFSSADVNRVVAVANQVATAISNAKLYQDLRRSYQELSRTQAELVRHERLAALGELAAVLAHEVRNPLGVIFNSVTSLRRALPHGEHAQALLDIVQEESERLNRLVSDLLDFSRPHDATMEPLCFEALIQSAIEVASQAVRGSEAQFQVELPSPAPPVSGDMHMLRQALVNLFVNALQAMPRGGTITIRVHARDHQTWSIDVEDEGVGIEERHLARIFEPFFTTKAMGTGLGLAVVKRIADAHGGTVEVRRLPNRGAAFSLCLPKLQQEAASGAA